MMRMQIIALFMCLHCLDLFVCVCVDNVGFNQPRAKLLPAQRGGPLWRKEIAEEVVLIDVIRTFLFARSLLCFICEHCSFVSIQDNGSRGDNFSLASFVSDEGVHRLRVL